MMAALWLLPLPGILFVVAFSGWTRQTAEMTRGIYLLFGTVFVVAVVGASYSFFLKCALSSHHGRSLIQAFSYLALAWLAFLLLQASWHGLAHLALPTWQIIAAIFAVAHFILLYHAKSLANKRT
jgi:hypothetical protein